MPEISAVISGAIASLAAALAVTTFARIAARERLAGRLREQGLDEAPADRLPDLVAALRRTSIQLSRLIAEIGSAADERMGEVVAIEAQLADLTAKENDLKQRIAALEGVPLAAADRFIDAIKESERRGVRRDLLLFVAGVVVTTLITLILSAIT